MPMHGYHYMLRVHADIAKACGRSEDEIVVPDNGAVIEIQDEGQKMSGSKRWPNGSGLSTALLSATSKRS